MTRKLILLASLLALAFLQSGCISLHRTIEREVQVVDAETLEPIGDAEIRIDYRYYLMLRAPKDFRTFTDTDGYATVTTTTFSGLSTWQIGAEGYLSIHGSPRRRDRLPESAYPVTGETNRRIWRIPLFREPQPVITIELPAEFRGPLLIDFQRDHDWSPGQPFTREINVAPNEHGVVTLKLPVDLANQSELRAARVGQPPMSPEYLGPSRELFDNPAHDEVAFRRVIGHIYCVGNQVDWVNMYLQFYEVTPNNGGINIQGKHSSIGGVEEFVSGLSPKHR